MRQLLKYLKPFRKELILGPVFKQLEAIFELIVPLVMASIIDIGVRNADKSYVLRMGGIMVLLGLVGLASTLVCQYMAAKASQGFGTVLRNEMFSHIVNNLSEEEIERVGASGLVNRITNDINQLQVGVAMFIRLLVRAPFLVIGASVMAIGISPKLSIIFISAAVGIAVLLYFIMSRSTPLYRNVQKKLDQVGLLVRETLGGSRVIRAFSRQKAQEDTFDKQNEQLSQASIRVGKLSALLNPGTFIVVNLAIIAILWFGGDYVQHGLLEQGQIIALVNYMTQIQLALVVVANLVIIFTRAGTSATRVAEVLDMEGSLKEGAMEVAAEHVQMAAEFKKVSFRYAGTPKNHMDLENVNLKIRKGETVGIIGGTGSGKSTLVKLLARMYDVTEGQITVEGMDVKDYTFDSLHKKIAVVPQKTSVFSGSIRDNLQWGNMEADDEQLWDALEIAQAKTFVSKYKEGLDARITQGGANLSGGQKQRLTIARALTGHPEILVLDDSSSALDFATDAALRKALSKMEGLTILMISQRVHTLMHANQIIVLDSGKVVGKGTHEQLMASNTIYQEIYRSQTEEDGA